MEDEVDFNCPFCGESISVMIDTSVPNQTYIEDCSVCCRPIQLTATSEEGAVTSLDVARS